MKYSQKLRIRLPQALINVVILFRISERVRMDDCRFSDCITEIALTDHADSFNLSTISGNSRKALFTFVMSKFWTYSRKFPAYLASAAA